MRSGWLVGCALMPGLALAQGQDSTQAARLVQILAVTLPGVWDNSDQVYFEGRAKSAARTPRSRIEIEPRQAGGFSATLSDPSRDDGAATVWTLSLSEASYDTVGLEIRDDGELACRLVLRRSAGQIDGAGVDGCDWHLALSPNALHLTREGRPVRHDRARGFTCHVDMPGVSGGRDEVFRRFGPFAIDDGGGEAWFETAATDGAPARTLGLSLRHVNWPVNNYDGSFARDTLVLGLLERDQGGRANTLSYVFVDPVADRVGINLRWAMAFCATVPGTDVTPHW